MLANGLIVRCEQEPFEVYAVGTTRHGHPWRSRITYPTHQSTPHGVMPLDWTWDRLQERLQPVLRTYRNMYGGDWVLEIRKPKRLTPPLERPRRAVPMPEMKDA